MQSAVAFGGPNSGEILKAHGLVYRVPVYNHSLEYKVEEYYLHKVFDPAGIPHYIWLHQSISLEDFFATINEGE